MNLRAGWLKDKIWSGATQEFFIIPVDKSEINISSFSKRDNENSEDLDSAIIKIINYFLQKWTFVLCDTWNIQWGDPKLKTKLLTVQDLHNVDVMKNLHICSSLELAAQQHSYLQQWWDRKVWIYLPEKQKIWWISLKEVMNPMNLGKKIETNKT